MLARPTRQLVKLTASGQTETISHDLKMSAIEITKVFTII